MNEVNWNKLRDKVHQNAVNKGFWEEERSIAECLALIHSEVSEALEADRNEKKTDKDSLFIIYAEYDGHIEHCIADKEISLWNTWINSTFIYNIKDTFEDELADVVIRCLDLCGHLDIDVDVMCQYYCDKFAKETNGTPEMLFMLHGLISDSAYMLNGWRFNKSKFSYIIPYVAYISKDLNIDLLKHIELKMKYNSLRPYKHGKKY